MSMNEDEEVCLFSFSVGATSLALCKPNLNYIIIQLNFKVSSNFGAHIIPESDTGTWYVLKKNVSASRWLLPVIYIDNIMSHSVRNHISKSIGKL